MTADEAAELLGIFIRNEAEAPRIDSRKLARCFGRIVAEVCVASSNHRSRPLARFGAVRVLDSLTEGDAIAPAA